VSALGVMGFFVVPGLAIGAIAWAIDRPLRAQGYRAWQSARSVRPEHDFRSCGSERLTGGCRVGLFNATWPLARLELDDRWAHLSALGLIHVWIDRAEVAEVRIIRALGSSGLRFETESGTLDGVIFWSFDSLRALRTFQRHGWPVPPPVEGPASY